MLNNLQSYQIIFNAGLGFYLGSVLAQIANTLFVQLEPATFDYSWIKNILFRNLIMFAVGGFSVLAIGSVDVGYLESFSLLSIFFCAFFLSLLAGATNTWLGIIKLIFSKITSSNSTI